MASAVEAKVREIICEQLGVSEDEVTPEASFIEDLGADSLDIVELVMAWKKSTRWRSRTRMRRRSVPCRMS